MKFLIVTFTTLYCFNSLDARNIAPDNDELILVHAIIRHGNRTPDDEIYPGNPYGNEKYYEPYGFAQLTNEGKRTEYKLGQALRNRYGSFLDKEYHRNDIDPRTTNVPRTKMSLLLVLAGLYPPTGSLLWNRALKWQPIPYNYYEHDKELSSQFVCVNYKRMYKSLLSSEKIQAQILVYKDVYEYLSDHTNTTVSTPNDVADIFLELKAQRDYGYQLENWTSKYFPYPMENITKDMYYAMTNTTSLKKIISGFLIKKIIEDSDKKIRETLQPPQRKLFIYSAHEKNIATLLLTLGVFDDRIPAYGSYILVEVHRVNRTHGLKFYYQNYIEVEPTLVTIPGCASFCPLTQFAQLMKEYVPEDEDCELKND
ncbi:venom acid phosphatase Acph-1-like [Cylas formicarius]|uniref:venom acid phosphatase Acph-1-like n=1 Tax=Cylas formicarius TaxID=197179 RepID=UPI0029583D1E|nr:venom acid phosphatase Acph-1-like [Cylas formicarius]